jgi:hypothetical protein
MGRLKRGEQRSTAAAQFQNPLARWNQELHEFPVILTIGSVELVAVLLSIQIGFDIVEKFQLAWIEV